MQLWKNNNISNINIMFDEVNEIKSYTVKNLQLQTLLNSGLFYLMNNACTNKSLSLYQKIKIL